MAFKGTPPDSYDEIFGADGSLRPAYLDLGRRFGFDVSRPTASITEQLRDRPLGDDVRVLPVPWALDGVEYSSVIQAGVAQRARALQMFFADLVIEGQRFLHGATSLTEARLDEILESEGTSLARLQSLWQGHGLEDVRFVYGPDLVRGPDGRWLVLEDNVGCVGGSADSHVVWSLYRRATGAPTSPSSSDRSDLRVAAEKWFDRLGLSGDDVVAVLGCEAAGEALRAVLIDENARRRLLLAPLGVEVVDSCQLERHLSFEGAAGLPAILNFHAASGLIDEAFRRKTPLFNAPGTGILGNKALLPHVDEMIRFFCDEEPVIATPATHTLYQGLLPPEPDDWVVKSASGCQGTDVFVLRSQPQARLDAIRDLVRGSWPRSGFVAQRRVEPSHLSIGEPRSWEKYLVELRPVTYVVGWCEAHVSRRPIGKAISNFDVRRQNNVSQGACYVPVALAAGQG